MLGDNVIGGDACVYIFFRICTHILFRDLLFVMLRRVVLQSQRMQAWYSKCMFYTKVSIA